MSEPTAKGDLVPTPSCGNAPDWLFPPNYPADAFAGTAWYYARYRVP